MFYFFLAFALAAALSPKLVKITTNKINPTSIIMNLIKSASKGEFAVAPETTSPTFSKISGENAFPLVF